MILDKYGSSVRKVLNAKKVTAIPKRWELMCTIQVIGFYLKPVIGFLNCSIPRRTCGFRVGKMGKAMLFLLINFLTLMHSSPACCAKAVLSLHCWLSICPKSHCRFQRGGLLGVRELLMEFWGCHQLEVEQKSILMLLCLSIQGEMRSCLCEKWKNMEIGQERLLSRKDGEVQVGVLPFE